MSILSIEELTVSHGLLQAVRNLSVSVEQGQTVALVGANGAGKSTLLRAIAGARPRPTSGRVVWDGEDLGSLSAHRRVDRGIALVPEGRRLFTGMTVEENLLVAARPGTWDMERVIDAFPLLRERRLHRARTLSGGERQATAIGRALMCNPKLLLLDEVSLGLAPMMVEDVYRSLTKVIDGGTTVLLVEQDLARALEVSDRVVCMLEGRVVLEGASRDLSRDQITNAYFGLAGQDRGAGGA